MRRFYLSNITENCCVFDMFTVIFQYSGHFISKCLINDKHFYLQHYLHEWLKNVIYLNKSESSSVTEELSEASPKPLALANAPFTALTGTNNYNDGDRSFPPRNNTVHQRASRYASAAFQYLSNPVVRLIFCVIVPVEFKALQQFERRYQRCTSRGRRRNLDNKF